TVFVFEDNIIFEINIFEKSNKEDFRYFLDENSNLTKSTKNDYCGSKTKKFFQRLYADGIISYECELYNLDTDSLPALKFLLNKIKNKDDILYKINYERKKLNGTPSACIGWYIKFLEYKHKNF
ncbi:hypothetical protein JGV49_001835, partial [Campylobacter jejuni]|nr:hypothetical protein [Campylobacter coli]EGW7238177.1 hypothetical protein [Campylobacter jejuni]EAH7779496.1 hypothetical protein [Campylobacter coli]EAH7948491.1 hypothetical protein [Campylobacter coli]EAJ3018690.1 hypothetical protein [Campylobacter coli]